MSFNLNALIALLDLETLEHNLFRGLSPQTGWQRVFGGQVIGQALVAASRTVENKVAHSLHGYFMRAGDTRVPIIYDVDRIRDGDSFATRRVVAIQHGRAIFSMSVSYQKPEEGFEHQASIPDVPRPDDLPSEAELKAQFIDHVPENIRIYWEQDRPIEMRPTDFSRFLNAEPADGVQHVWMRATGALPKDHDLHQCVLAYASDFFLLDTSLIPHGRDIFDPKLFLASLDHAMWFHDGFKADDWLLYTMDSPRSKGGRGFNRGQVFTTDGRLVASTAQEGLIRERR